MKARLLLADDHEVIRIGLRTFLSEQRPEWEICGEARDGREAVRLDAELSPDVVILDLTMPVLGGFEALHQIKQTRPEAKVVILTSHSASVALGFMRDAGALAIIEKGQIGRDLITAVDKVLTGQTFYPAPIEQLPPDTAFKEADQQGPPLVTPPAFGDFSGVF